MAFILLVASFLSFMSASAVWLARVTNGCVFDTFSRRPSQASAVCVRRVPVVLYNYGYGYAAFVQLFFYKFENPPNSLLYR
eukprot:scaffold232602_cov46-Prasinocladus_malaysianus.AAC.2